MEQCHHSLEGTTAVILVTLVFAQKRNVVVLQQPVGMWYGLKSLGSLLVVAYSAGLDAGVGLPVGGSTHCLLHRVDCY